MAHLLTPATTIASTAFSTRSQKSSSLYSWKNGSFQASRVCCVAHQDDHSLPRRALVGLGGGAVVLGLGFGDEKSAMGAARRPPPSPPKEKTDPNMSAVQAKVLASKKRKEAMKESVAKLREKGNPLNKDLPPAPKETPPPPPPEEPPSPPAPEEPPSLPALE